MLKPVEDGQIVDAALCPIGKAEARQITFREKAVLDANQMAFTIIIRYLQPIDTLAIPPRGESAPADDAFVELSLIEEEVASRLAQERMLEEAGVAGGVES